MKRLNPIAGFAFGFALLYGLLILPWPGWNDAYGSYFRAMSSACFRDDGGRRMIRFDAAHTEHPSIDTSITIANRDGADAGGRIHAKVLWLDARSVGWVPTALIVALTSASPVPWRRRLGALVLGLLLVQLFIVFSVGCYIWNESASLGLATFTPFWKTVADGLEETLVTQLGASFVVPALIWVVVTFRVKDLDTVFRTRLPASKRLRVPPS
jgi:hypothetical protein